MTFFTKLEQIILKCIWNKRPRIAKESLRKKDKIGGIIPPDFRQYYKATVTKTVWYWQQNREPRNKSTHLWSINRRQMSKNIQWGKDSPFSKWWGSWVATCKSMKLEHSLTTHTKQSSKWLKGLNIRHETMKLLEENIGKTFCNINCTNVFLCQSPKAKEIKAKINK